LDTVLLAAAQWALVRLAGPILKPTAVLKGMDAGQVMLRPLDVWLHTKVALLPSRDTD
jgi:hypothetical protein